MKKLLLLALLAAAVQTHAQQHPSTPDDSYRLVFSDEFNAPDYSRPDPGKWKHCQREKAVWNRWLSPHDSVAFLRDGQLILKAIPTPASAPDTIPMITGGIQSRGLFEFLYGKVEARIRTFPHNGNFPAFWLMPTDRGITKWPDCGEIDIWEQIDTTHRAYHTVHSRWTRTLGNTHNPRSSHDEPLDMDQYHVYTLEWTPDTLRWYVDGNPVGIYAKSSDPAHLEQGQWPFDKPYYIILNQSVGNGSWAKPADTGHSYETRVDWVRVYQKNRSCQNRLPYP